MSYNGSGLFQINTSGQPVVAGTVITASAFNALTADLATGLTTAITKDGQTATTAQIPFAQGLRSTLVTDSTTSSSGSIITDGGLGVAKAITAGSTITGTKLIPTGTSVTGNGMYLPAANNVGITTNGTQAFLANAVQGIQIPNTLGVGAATPSTSGAGITFPATQSQSSNANTLDDYEEGTWTPTITLSTMGTCVVTYNGLTGGVYTKIGNLVTLSGSIYTTSMVLGTGSGSVLLGGFPFAVSADTGPRDGEGGISIGRSGGFVTFNPVNGFLQQTQTYCTLQYRATLGGDSTALLAANLPTATGIYIAFTLTYRTSA